MRARYIPFEGFYRAIGHLIPSFPTKNQPLLCFRTPEKDKNPFFTLIRKNVFHVCCCFLCVLKDNSLYITLMKKFFFWGGVPSGSRAWDFGFVSSWDSTRQPFHMK